MRTLSYYSAIDQSIRKFRLASHCLSFLCLKTTVPIKTIDRFTLKNAIKRAKKEGFDPKQPWREYPCKWHLRPHENLPSCICEPPCSLKPSEPAYK